jgi:hypothetical protein
MDLFPVAVQGFRIISCGRTRQLGSPGGPSTIFGLFATLSLYRYSLLCTYYTNSRRRFDSGPDQILRKRPFLPSVEQIVLGSRSRWELQLQLLRRLRREQIALGTAAAAAAKAAAGALWQPGGRAGPGTLSLDVPHHTPAGHR